MNVFTLSIPSSSQNRTLTYTVQVKSYTNLWKTVFNGKVFVTANQSSVNIELSDILWNHKFNGDNYIAPAINPTGDNYIMCSTSNTLQNYWYNDVKVEIPSVNVSTTKTVCFFDYNMFNTNITSVANNTVALFMDYQPVAHIPANTPEGFNYRQLVWKGYFTKNTDNSSTTVQRSNLGVITFSGATKTYGINGRTIAQIDQCAKPYYLVWMTCAGGMQVQGFTKASEASVTYKRNNRVDMSNWKWNFNKTVTGSWNLKSGNLSDKEYKAYMEMCDSPYVILLDMENNKLHYVNIKKDSIVQKHNESKKKPIYFEIDVESCEVKI